MRITQKLGVLVAVPLCAVSGFGAIALVNSASGAVGADHLWSLMNTSNAAGQLICELQDERTYAALFLTSALNMSAGSDLYAQIAKTDAAVRSYTDLAGRLPHTGSATTRQVRQVTSDLAQLRTLRNRMLSGAAPALSAVIFQYRIVIADLAAFRDGVAQAGGASPAVAAKIQAANALYVASESTGQEEATVLRVAINAPLTQSAQQDIAADRRGYSDALETFVTLATPEWQQRPDQALSGLTIADADASENTIARAPLGTDVHLNAGAWTYSMTARREALDEVQRQLNLQTLQEIGKVRSRERTLAGLEAASIAGTLLIAVVVSLRLGRPMIRGLRELRDGAHAVAYEHLPAAVEALRASGSLTGRTPEEFAQEFGEAVPAEGKDELAAVARAFNAVHHEVIRTAAEQVLLRAGVGATFVALARRGERLTGELTFELDRAERDEQDPDRLARLFVLDHLAARMSRNNESLLVLGGEGTARIRDTGVPLNDVIRGALGRIERYTRVDLAVVDPGIVVAPSAVDHLVHLCAELLDNATTFSAPESRVSVEARQMADRVIIQIADHGIGMTPAQRGELNARLASPPPVDVTTVRTMGLTVVAHLASWYGIDIELRPRPEGGTIAELTLPPAVYTAPDTQVVETHEAAAIAATAWVTPLPTPAPATLTVEASVTRAEQVPGPRAIPAGEAVRPVTAGAAGPERPDQAWPDRTWPDQGSTKPAGARHRWRTTTADVTADVTAGADADGWSAGDEISGPDRTPRTAPTATSAPAFGTDQPAWPMSPFEPAASQRTQPRPADPVPPRHAASAMTPVPLPGFPPPEEPPLSPWLAGPRRTSLSPSHSAMPVTMSGAPAWPSVPVETTPPDSTVSAVSTISTAVPEPASQSAATAPSRAPETTLHGLPIRVPMARLPAEALAAADGEPVAATPTERDPGRVSASMAAYARGLTGRPAPPPGPPREPSQSPYPSMPSSGKP